MSKRAIVVDLQVLQSPGGSGARGMGRYALGLTKGLLAAGAPVAAVTTLPGANQPALPSELRPLAIPATAGAVRSVVGGSFTWLATAPLDAPSYPARVVPAFVAEVGGAVAAVAYDLIPLAHPDRSFGTERDRLWYLGRLVGLRGADLLLAISTFTARDLVERLGLRSEQVVAIGTGIDPVFTTSTALAVDQEVLARRWPELRTGAVLTVGFDWRKNQRVLFEAWARLPRELRGPSGLVVAGWVPDGFRAEWSRWCEELGIDPAEVLVTGALADRELVALYRTCAVFAFPAVSEGFGLPPAEAAASGAAVLVAETTSLPEAVPVPEALVEPSDPAAWARRLTALLRDPSDRASLAAACRAAVAGHTWEAVGRRAALALATLDHGVPASPRVPAARPDPLSVLIAPHVRARLNRPAGAG